MSDTPGNGSDRKETLVIDGQTGKADDTPGVGAFGKDRRRIDLSSLRDVRIELAKLYRCMDAGEVTSADGSRRAYVLKTIHDVIVSAELEQRLQELEDRQRAIGGRSSAMPAERRLN